jgi:teichuronic acid biosynthesis glycosyltransferase TuaG
VFFGKTKYRMPTVSVIIPTYNREEELLRAVRSVLAQTVPALEILVCDDGSTDGSKAMIEVLGNPAVRWIDCGRNGRPAIPRNIGIGQARGDYVAFLDSDDAWLPVKIERQLAALESSGCRLASSNANRIIDGRNTGPYISYEKARMRVADMIPVNWVICSTVMVERALLETTARFPEESKYKAVEDYALWLRLAATNEIAYVSEPLIDYYDDPKSSIRSDYDKGREREIIFPDYVAWLLSNNVTLRWADARKVLRIYYKCMSGGKLTLANRIRTLLSRFPSPAEISR